MAINISAWNAHESLAQARLMPDVVEAVKGFESDIVVLSDAYSLTNPKQESHPEVLGDAINRIEAEGYSVFQTEYNDTEPWHHDRNIMLLSRLAVTNAGVLRLASRNALEVQVEDDHKDLFHVIGAHLDDRRETIRLGQAKSFIKHVEKSRLAVLAGDLNAVYGYHVTSKLFNSRLARTMAKQMPQARARSIATRITDMSSGDTIAYLNGEGFETADIFCRPTFPANFPFLELDHIMSSRQIIAGQFQRTREPSLSDHQAVTATLSVV